MRMLDAMQRRYSCRTYANTALAETTRQELADFCAAQRIGPLGSTARFTLIAAEEDDRAALKGLGTYGFIKHPTGFIIGAVSAGRYNLEDYGYLLEHIILQATALELGTCWLGGSFTKSSFGRKIGLRAEELLPAVASVGYPADRRTLIDRVIRRSASGDQRLPWEMLFFANSFDAPLKQADAGPYADALAAVRQGPSASNKQPWRVVRAGAAWHFYLAHTPGYGRPVRAATGIELQRVDIGIALCHFALAARELGLSGAWAVQEPGLAKPNPDTEYVVSWVAGHK